MIRFCKIRAGWGLAFFLLAGSTCVGAQLYTFAPGKLDRIVVVLDTFGSGVNTIKTTNFLAPNEPFNIVESTFPNGQTFKVQFPNQPPVQPLLSGGLTFQFPEMTPDRDISGIFQPPMPVTVKFEGAWSKAAGFGYGAARATMGSLQPTACPVDGPSQINTGPPITEGTHPVSFTRSCDMKSLAALPGNDPLEVEQAVNGILDVIAGDGGSNGGPIFLGVGAKVQFFGIYKSRRRPEITLPSVTLKFTHTDGQPLPPAQTIVLTNTGGLTLNWTASIKTIPADGTWLKVSPGGGPLDSLGKQPLEVSVDPTGLAPGDYSATVTVDGDTYNGSKEFRVTFKFIGTPKLTVTPTSLEFFNRVAIPEQTLTLENEGSARLVWQAVPTSDGNWLNPQSTSDALDPGQTKELRIRAFVFFPDPPLENGDHGGQIVFQPYPNPVITEFPPVKVTGVFHVLPPADELSISPGSVVPATNDPVYVNTDYDNFRAQVTYQLGSRSKADLALRLFDEQGNLQASSDFISVTNKEGRVVDRTVTIPKFKITLDAEGKSPEKLILRAVLIDRTLLTPILITSDTEYVYNVSAVQLRGLEVTQVIQDLKNSVPLVRGKPTFVRAHLYTTGSKAVKVEDVKLHGTRNGQPLPFSPLDPVNPGNAVTALPKDAARREVPDSSANFVLPPTWVESALDLRFEAKGVGCKPDVNSPDKCKQRVEFVVVPVLQVKYLSVRWTNESGVVLEASPAEISAERTKVASIFPNAPALTPFPIGILPYNQPGDFNVLLLLNLISDVSIREGCGEGCSTFYMALVKGLPEIDFETLEAGGQPTGYAASGLSSGGATSPNRNIVSHRLARALGIPNAVHGSLGMDRAGRKIGWCDEHAQANTPNYPEFAEINGKVGPTLGPMTAGEDLLVYGMDASVQAGSAGTKGNVYDFKVVSPFKTYDLMSYCPALTWPSKYTYQSLITGLPAQGQSRALLQAAAEIRDYLLISGTVNWKLQTGSLGPLAQLRSKGPRSPAPTGDYSLRLRDALGKTLATVSFQPLGLEEGPQPETPDLVPFLLMLPVDPAIKQVALLHGEVELAIRSASPNPPTVKILAPNGGETLNADPVTIRWQGSDLDGDTLSYDVEFSPDGGLSWQTLALQWRSDTYDVPQHYFTATTNGRIRVTARDGFHVASDVSDTAFTVPNHPPSVTILSPPSNYYFIGSQPVVLRVEATDPDGVEIPEVNVEWKSDRNGVLGKGSWLQQPASAFTEGAHVISVTARDNGGAEVTRTVDVRVSRIAASDLADLEVSTASEQITGVVGGNLDLDMTVFNHGPNDAAGVKLTTVLPAGLSFVGATLSQGAFVTADQLVNITLGDMAAGSAATVRIVAKVATKGPGVVAASLTGSGTDLSSGNNELTIATMGTPSPIQIKVSRAGEKITFSWRGDDDGAVLQSNSDPTAKNGWSPVGGTPSSSNGVKSVTVDADASARFYRLAGSP